MQGVPRQRTLDALADALPEGWAVPVLAAAASLHAIAAWRNAGFFGADEHYLIIEFAQHKLGRQALSGLAWEFAARVRPALQPLIAAGAIAAWHRVGVASPFVIATSLRILSSVLGLWAALALCARCLPTISDRWLRGSAVLITLFLWMGPFVHGRFSSENWGGALWAAGLCVLLDAADAWPVRRSRAVVAAVSCGLIWSAAFYCRFQIGFMIAGAGLWMLIIRGGTLGLVSIAGAAFVAGCGLNECADRWLYGLWSFVPWRYFSFNLVQGGAATFGVAPWWRLAVYAAVGLIPPYSLGILAVLLAGAWPARRHLLVWATVPLVVAHGVIGHKEARFLFPLLYVVGPLLAVSAASLPWPARKRLLAWLHTPFGQTNLMALCVINAGLLVATLLVPAHETYPLYRWLWDHSQARPLTLYTIGGSPYELSGADNSFYRSDNVRLLPIETASELVTALRQPGEAPRFIYYRGLERPPLLGQAGVECPAVFHTFPTWLPPIDYFNLLADAQLATICEPTATPKTIPLASSQSSQPGTLSTSRTRTGAPSVLTHRARLWTIRIGRIGTS
jgi:phosphatidylinositol glycan class B